MSKSLNKVMLIGRLGADPEIIALPNGTQVANFSIATDEGYTKKDSQEKVEQTEWHRIVAFGKLAEIIGKYLKKGSLIYAEGKLQTDSWKDDNEIVRYVTKIKINEMTMLDSKNDQQSQSPTKTDVINNANKPQSKPQNSTIPAPSPSKKYDDFDDDIPF